MSLALSTRRYCYLLRSDEVNAIYATYVRKLAAS